jgi:hypothetical protein
MATPSKLGNLAASLGKGFSDLFFNIFEKYSNKIGKPRKPPLDILLGKGYNLSYPHSLGILIKWKLPRCIVEFN